MARVEKTKVFKDAAAYVAKLNDFEGQLWMDVGRNRFIPIFGAILRLDSVYVKTSHDDTGGKCLMNYNFIRDSDGKEVMPDAR